MSRKTFRRASAAAGALVGAAFLASYAKNSPQDTWKPKGDAARKIDNLQRPVFLVAGIVGVLVVVEIGRAHV